MDLHGGNIYKIMRENQAEKLIDYSSNINPFGVPESLKEAVVDNFDLLTRYPDIDYVELREKIAKYNKLNQENIVVGNGAVEVIFMYMKTFKPNKVLIVSPTFAEYERALIKTTDAKIEYFELKESEEFVLNTQSLKERLNEKYDLLIICNPNNPTGKFIAKETMTDILEECNKFDTKLFIDEAFIEFVEGSLDNTIASEREINKKNLFILRALTKFFAIPGLRFGYGICFDKELKNRMECDREPWTVNAFAELAGKILLNDLEYIMKSENWVRKEKSFMFEKLSLVNNIKVYKTDTNFILIKLRKINSKELRKLMIAEGIVVRDASNFVYLDDRFIRLAVKDRETNIVVIDKLKKVLESLD